MKHGICFRTALVLALATLAISLTLGAGTTLAQCPGCPGPAPGLGYWVNYNYVYPPAPPGSITLTLRFANGHVESTSGTSDGHYTFDQDPFWGPAVSATVTWPGGSATFPVPCPKTPVSTPWGILNIEIKCNPCMEIDVSY